MRRPENAVQIAIVNWLKLNKFTFTSTNGGLFINNIRTKSVIKALGYRKGVSDIVIWIPNGTLCVEVKKPPLRRYSLKTGKMIVAEQGGRQSEEQKIFEKEVNAISGHHYIVVDDVKQLIDYIEQNKIKPC